LAGGPAAISHAGKPTPARGLSGRNDAISLEDGLPSPSVVPKHPAEAFLLAQDATNVHNFDTTIYMNQRNLRDLIDQRRINLAEVANLNLEDVTNVIP